jgi:membrane-anchored mycosin MYCP
VTAPRVLAAALTVGAVWLAPAAQAVVPPAVDDTLLPPAQPATPPTPTEPTGDCHTTAPPLRGSTSSQLTMLDLAAAQRLSRGSGQTVAVIDTGVSRHRLLPRLTAGGDYVSTGDGTRDCDGHGTTVAGIVAATGDDRFTGVAPDAAILAIRQSSNMFRRTDDHASSGVGDVDTLALAVRTAADLGATVINISTVACVPADVGIDDGALGAALEYAVDVKNVVVVSAAGNVGRQCSTQNPTPSTVGQPDWGAVQVVVSPAWYDDYVLTVGSVDADGEPSRFTLAGPWVDVAAPGEAVVSLSADGEHLTDATPGATDRESLSGTSYAAPVVAGVAALVRARAPQLTARQVMQRIEQTARHPAAGWDPYVGFGVVDPLAAVSGVGAPAAAPAPGVPITVPPSAVPDGRSRTVAFGGAALAVLVAGAIALTAGRLRGRDVPRD